MDVSAWLRQLGLEEYAAAFAANHIDPVTLRQLTADDLRDIGIDSVGHRRRLLEAIAQLDAPASETRAAAKFDTERRPVAVLFADLCGFTALSRDLPDERLHELLGRYLSAADEVVKRHGGTVDKHIGDAVMALFGAPVAHDDDMLRALHAAAELRDRMPELSRALGRDISMHAGLAVGEVIVGVSGGGYTAIGESVNLAARLTDLAPAGEIFVSEPVQRALAGHAQFEARGRYAVKGFTEPVDIWRLAALAHPDPATSLTPFVGRRAELAQIAALLDSCAGTGCGGTVYVRGEPGIGKSRLGQEACALAMRRAIPCHVCHVLDFGAGQERDPLRRLADSLLELAADSAPDTRLAAVRALIAAEPVDARLQPFLHELAEAPLAPALRSLIDASDEASRRRGRDEALAFLVRRALSRAPMLLLVEDLHWADASLVEALVRLTSIGIDRPLVLVLTSRPENEHLYEALRSQPAVAPLVTIDVGPLRTQDATAIAGHLAVLPDTTRRQCIERAGGNPLFLEQLLRNVAETAGDLPLSLRGLVVARVDRLRAADRAALHAAAVLGQRFDPAALLALVGNPAFDVASLLRAGLLRTDGRELVFAHALIREAVLRSLLAEALRALHARAADWFDGRDPILRASHLDRAESPAAADAYHLAAEDRLRRYRPAEALPLVERGLALAAAADSRAALLLLKGDALLDAGRSRDALAAYQETPQAGGDRRNRSLALLGSAAARRILDELPAALDDVASAQVLAKSGGWLDIQARCHFTRGNLFFPLGRVDECLVEHRAALDLADRSGSAEAKARALGGLGDAEYARGDNVASADYFRRCVEESRLIGLGRVEVSNRPMHAHTMFFELKLQDSLVAGEEAVALAVAVGQNRAEMIAHHACVGPLLELGRAEEARPHIERARAIVRELEAWRFEPENLAFLAEVEVEGGRPDLARPLLAEGLLLARRTAMSYWGPALLAANAWLAEDDDKRVAFVAEAETLLSGKVLAHNHYLARRALIELGRILADPAMIEDQCAKLEAFYRIEARPLRETMPLADFLVRRGRVLAAALRGNPLPEMAAEARALVDWSGRTGAVRLGAGLDVAARRLGA
ncbi:MAG TPA: adenylate/guanylate cyclase domain-containing protein [Bradyrhizobium sp.]|nr:adenylate/guanylate cyclase domain-containing protein [Bradyrhizobium sp.]